MKSAKKHPEEFPVTREPGQVISLVTEVLLFNYLEVNLGDRRFPMHLHHFHQLDVALEGKMMIVLENCPPFSAKNGDAWLIPPLMRHRVYSMQDFRLAHFKLLISPCFWRHFGASFQQFHLSAPLLGCIKKAGERARLEVPLSGQQLLSIASLCLIEGLDQIPQQEQETDNLDEFRQALWPLLERIRLKPEIGWTVQRMAEECALSTDYFSRCFHRVVGQMPHNYVRENSMRAGAGMLLEVPAKTIKEIAEQSGYATVQAFTRAFTKVFQMTPAAYRRQAVHDRGAFPDSEEG
jgi:AraC-like DNA-binding protein